MRIACIGGGPAGLYFAISVKLRDPSHEVVIHERNRADDTFGWGVVLSDLILETLRANDAVSADAIHANFAYWDDIDVIRHGRSIRSGGHGFCGIGRKRLLNILQERAASLGVEQRFTSDIDDLSAFAGYDLIIAADGANSRIREQRAEHFLPDVDLRPNRFVWLGSDRKLDAFTFVFENTEHGQIWLHAYQFEPETSTVIVECGPETWEGLGFPEMEADEAIARCEELFADFLGGARLRSNASHLRGSAIWMRFPRIHCERWYEGNVVLMGDAAHTAHYSIGSGSRLAMEDAIDLAGRLCETTLPEALVDYEEARKLEVMRLQSSARNSMEWFENLSRYEHLDAEQFAYALLTRSQRVSHENLRLRDPVYLAELETWFARRATGRATAEGRPPMFTPFHLRDLELTNRVVVSPMSMYSSVEGMPGDFHLVHYGSRAQGGAGLVVTEMTDVERDGRITPGCAGIWNDEQAAAWKRIVDYVHDRTPAKLALQLGHAGPKGATKLEWEGANEPLEEGGWPLLAASAIPWTPANQVPRAMTRADMDRITEAYRRRRRNARPGRASTWSSCISPTATCSRASSRRSRTTARTSTAAASRTACATRSRSSPPCGARSPPAVRSPCASRRPTGSAPPASRGTTRSRSATPSPRRARTSSTSPPARPPHGLARSTAACSRRRSPIRCATRRASPRWRSATSPRPTT